MVSCGAAKMIGTGIKSPTLYKGIPVIVPPGIIGKFQMIKVLGIISLFYIVDSNTNIFIVFQPDF